MKLSQEDIRYMVSECINRILCEYHGAIDDRLKSIAEIIISHLRKGYLNFTLLKNDFEQYYPYKHCPECLNICVQKMGENKFAAYSPSTNTLKITTSFIFFDDDYLIEIMMHELTHWVNTCESNKINNGRYAVTPNNEKEKLLKEILYLFDSSEIQARTSQLKWYLNKKTIRSGIENVTHLKRMEFLINEIEKETYFEYENSFGCSDEFGTIIEGLLSQRAYYKYTIDGKERWSNFLSKKEFNAAKLAILKKLKRKYRVFKTNIDKLFFDFKEKIAH